LDAAGNVVGQVSRTYTLYAGGSASARQRRVRTAQQREAAEKTDEKSDKAEEKPEDKGDAKMEKETAPALLPEERREADPQMTFKSCVPVSAIRALVK
jgi:sRNA-binding protein